MGFNRVDTSNIKGRIAQLEQESKSSGQGGGSDVRWFRLPVEQSKTKIRFLPPVGKMTDYGKVVYTHFQLPTKEISQIKCFKTYGMDCPMCNLLSKYTGKFDVSNWEPAQQVYFNALVREQHIADRSGTMVAQAIENVNDPRCLSFSGIYTLEWLLKEIDEGGDITDPMQGYDVVFERIKYKGKFERRIMRQATPIAATPEEVNAIAEKCYDLEGDTFRPPSEEYVKRMQQVCAAVQKTIEEKLMPLQQAPASYAQDSSAPQTYQQPAAPIQQQVAQPAAPIQQQVAQPAAPMVQQPVAQGFNATGNPPPNPSQMQPAMQAGTPPNAPQCFGNPTVYDPQGNQKCMICHVEFDCQRSCAAKTQAVSQNTGHNDGLPFAN